MLDLTAKPGSPASEWTEMLIEMRAFVQSMGEWPRDKGLGPRCPCHGARQMHRVSPYTYRCQIDQGEFDFFLDIGGGGITMRPTSRIAGVNP